MRHALAAAAIALLPMAASAQGDPNVLRMAPAGDLRVLDPIWTSAAITLNFGQMIYDVVLTTDSQLRPQPQMAESWRTSDDGLTWTFTLRPNLAFHDGTPVTANDVVASWKRWAARVTAGQVLFARVASLTATDPRTVELKLKEPFGPVLEALSSPVLAPFVMRAADAATDPFQQVRTTVGSGPFRFEADQHRQGDRVVYSRNPAYVPRSEPADGYAGGKIAHFPRVEWIYLPDASTQAQALIKGEIDVIETLQSDLVPLMRRNRDVEVRVLNQLGTVGHIRPNSLQPPFSDPRARQALLALLDQAEFIAATTPDPSLGRECHSLFTCGTPLESSAGIAEWSRPDPERAKRLLAEAGYRGEPVVLMDPADQPSIHAIALVTADALRRIGVNVQVETMDWSTLVTRRNNKGPLGPGLPGWNLAFTTWGGFTFASVLTNTPLVSTCDGANLYGWPCDEALERLRSAYFNATTPEATRAAADALQLRYFQVVPYVNTGIFQQASAWRRDLSGIRATFYPVAWNIQRRAR
jgi:peptide/nickel transport system substrate-binding protein